MTNTLVVDYPGLLDTIKGCLLTGRTESHALLVWFLQHYFRLDETTAQDTVCDGSDDKGIDGVYIDENLETVFVFQSKLAKSPGKTLGDTQLKEFVGTLAQFKDVNQIVETTGNKELASLLTDGKVAQLIEDGYAVKGIFVTNILADANATNYLAAREDVQLFDKGMLENEYIPVGPTDPLGTPVSFDVFGHDCATYPVGDVTVVVAPLKGSDLVKLDGIASTELFAWNVRGSLGRTKVNKDISQSLEEPSEHKNFLLYHNGLTILCRELELDQDKITISGYSVVNGCQSLTSLYDKRTKITDDLRLLARLIKLSPQDELVEKITHHSNNQNPINARDLQSNSTIQRRLQNEFFELYGGVVFYRIKRGEPDQAPQVIDNDEAGRMLLAFDLEEPWTCHQSYKVLDELHSAIFARPEVNAHRVLAVADLNEAVGNCLGDIENELLGAYRLTRYFILYLLRQALELDGEGLDFCRAPSNYMTQENGRARIRACAERIIKDLIIDLNGELKDRDADGRPFDYKREFKSPKSVRDLSKDIISAYHKTVSRGRLSSFAGEWAASASAGHPSSA